MIVALILAMLGLEPTGPPTVFPRPAHIVSVDHMPLDSLERDRFVTGFNAALTETLLSCQTRAETGWTKGRPVDNRFNARDGEPADDAWTVEVTLGLPPPRKVTRQERHRDPSTGEMKTQTIEKSDLKRRASRGLTVVVAIVPPGTTPHDPRPAPVRSQVVLPVVLEEGESAAQSANRGYLLPWTEAGRAAGLLVLEALHHQSHDVSDSLRFDVSPSIRVDTH